MHNAPRASPSSPVLARGNLRLQPSLDPIRREAAARLFIRLIDCFDTLPADRNDDYNRVKLVRLTYEYARTDESKGNFLRAFFDSVGIANTFDGEEVDLANADQRASLHTSGHILPLFSHFFSL
ncbi:hypothetical protein V2G26_019576 [Clonostachys chloroleuca]